MGDALSNEAERQASIVADAFGTKELLQLVVKKLSSQALLFGLVMIVILVVAYKLFGNQGLPIIAAILFVFIVATIAYLFFEQKGKVEREDPTTMSQLLGERMRSIETPSEGFSVSVWVAAVDETASVRGTASISRDVGLVPKSKDMKNATHHIGDKVNVHFSSTRDCYLTLLNVGTSGKLTILFPNALHRDNSILANRTYTIPGDDYGFEYELQGPPGIEKLKAIATIGRTDLLESRFAQDGSLFRTIVPSVAARDIAVIKSKVEALPIHDWAEATCEFRVVPR